MSWESSVQQQKYLAGAVFPASKDAVIAALQRNGAPNQLIGTVQSDAANRYVSSSHVSHVWRRAL